MIHIEDTILSLPNGLKKVTKWRGTRKFDPSNPWGAVKIFKWPYEIYTIDENNAKQGIDEIYAYERSTGNGVDTVPELFVLERHNYRNGKKNGAFEIYNDHGELIEKGEYKDDELEGSYEFNEYYHGAPTGRLYEKRIYSYSHSKREKTSILERYRMDGTLIARLTIEDGRENGPYEFFHQNGKLEQRGTFKDGNHEGLCECFHDNGKLAERLFYEKGIESGLDEVYDRNGKLCGRYIHKKHETIDKMTLPRKGLCKLLGGVNYVMKPTSRRRNLKNNLIKLYKGLFDNR